jgi:hypothetical protein
LEVVFRNRITPGCIYSRKAKRDEFETEMHYEGLIAAME